ncbi:CU044_5270 family protein [Paeniglutamicibacter sp. R2-26]|uniref:CU044_5270 family protein n=1 Tax=Paeniglutamicibacter sp. R2-26 TaxID=3144417 RepID=UPI003EE7D942
MNTNEFQTDRTKALRRQLVEMPVAHEAARFLRKKNHGEVGSGKPKRPHRRGKVVFALAAVGVGLMVLGQINVTAQSAQAAGLLRATAEQAKKFIDPVPGPSQYLLVSTHANWMVSGEGFDSYMEQQMIDVYVPAEAKKDWVLDRDWGGQQAREIIHAADGRFYGSAWVSQEFPDLDTLPRDGEALYKLIDDSYTGGSASRAEDNFVRITDLLRSGLVPADLRAGLYEALALVPGVTSQENQKNFDGKSGTAIGRTELLRGGERAEIIIDPNTGLVIGERSIATIAAFGFGLNEVTGHTAIDYKIVDSAPAATSK